MLCLTAVHGYYRFQNKVSAMYLYMFFPKLSVMTIWSILLSLTFHKNHHKIECVDALYLYCGFYVRFTKENNLFIDGKAMYYSVTVWGGDLSIKELKCIDDYQRIIDGTSLNIDGDIWRRRYFDYQLILFIIRDWPLKWAIKCSKIIILCWWMLLSHYKKESIFWIKHPF